MSNENAQDTPDHRPAVGGPVERTVGRMVPARATVGDVVAVDVRHPYPQTMRMTLETKSAADKANEQQAMEPKVWRLEKHVFPPPATANRYCRAEMCLETDTAHEPWCGRHKTPNAAVVRRPQGVAHQPPVGRLVDGKEDDGGIEGAAARKDAPE